MTQARIRAGCSSAVGLLNDARKDPSCAYFATPRLLHAIPCTDKVAVRCGNATMLVLFQCAGWAPSDDLISRPRPTSMRCPRRSLSPPTLSARTRIRARSQLRSKIVPIFKRHSCDEPLAFPLRSLPCAHTRLSRAKACSTYSLALARRSQMLVEAW